MADCKAILSYLSNRISTALHFTQSLISPFDTFLPIYLWWYYSHPSRVGMRCHEHQTNDAHVPQPQGPITCHLVLVIRDLGTLPEVAIFTLSSSPTVIEIKAYRAQIHLTQCYNCQILTTLGSTAGSPQKGPQCGGSHHNQECPKKDNGDSIPKCCKFKVQHQSS
jgi:hypothetical protein